MQMSKPREIVDLDLLQESSWQIKPDAWHLYHGKLWRHEQTGCVLCVECERNDAHGQTLQLVDDERQRICLTHGALEEVAYSITRKVIIKIGVEEREVVQSITDALLIPADLDPEERDELLDRLISAAAESEADPDLNGPNEY